MARMQAGDTSALGELYDRHKARAYSVASKICRDHARAEEAVQEAFISVWRGRGLYLAEKGEVGAWLMIVVRNRAIDLARRDQRHAVRRAFETGVEYSAPGDDDARAVVDRIYAETDLRAHVARLPAAQREAIVLAYYGELSCAEIASHLGIPTGTVKGRLRLALCKLRRELDAGIADEGVEAAPRAARA